MHAYAAEAFASARIADFHREADAARLAAGVGAPAARPRPWTALGVRLAAWAERPRAGRSLGVCCPV